MYGRKNARQSKAAEHYQHITEVFYASDYSCKFFVILYLFETAIQMQIFFMITYLFEKTAIQMQI